MAPTCVPEPFCLPSGGWGSAWRWCGPDLAWQHGGGCRGSWGRGQGSPLELGWEGPSRPVSGRSSRGWCVCALNPPLPAVSVRCLSLRGQRRGPCSCVSSWTFARLLHPRPVPLRDTNCRSEGHSSLDPLQRPGARTDLGPSSPKDLEVTGTWFQPLRGGISRGGRGEGPRDSCFQVASPPSPVLPGLFLVFN